MRDRPGDKITIRVGRDVIGDLIAGSGITYVNQREPKPRHEEGGPVQVNIARDDSTIYAVGRGGQQVDEVLELPESAG
jgi:hypothetical protein